MYKIEYINKEGYEDNYYDTSLCIEVNEDTNIHSYVNAFILSLKAVGFLDVTIKSGLEEGIAEVEEVLNVNSTN